MPDLSGCHIIDAPRIGHPVGCGYRLIARMFNIYMGNISRDPICCLPSLKGRAGTAVDGGINRPDGRTLVQTAQPHTVLILSPDAMLRHPQPTVHSAEDGVGLVSIWLGVLTNDFGYACSQTIAAIVISRTMGDGSTTIIECIAGPDAAIGVVEMVTIRVVVALLPRQV